MIFNLFFISAICTFKLIVEDSFPIYLLNEFTEIHFLFVFVIENKRNRPSERIKFSLKTNIVKGTELRDT